MSEIERLSSRWHFLKFRFLHGFVLQSERGARRTIATIAIRPLAVAIEKSHRFFGGFGRHFDT